MARSWARSPNQIGSFGRNMKTSLLLVVMLCAMSGLAQEAPKPTENTAPPVIDTANRLALQVIEKQKQDLNEQFIKATQQELVIQREWAMSHPGWHIDMEALQRGQFLAAKDAPKAEPKKPEEPKASEPKKK